MDGTKSDALYQQATKLVDHYMSRDEKRIDLHDLLMQTATTQQKEVQKYYKF